MDSPVDSKGFPLDIKGTPRDNKNISRESTDTPESLVHLQKRRLVKNVILLGIGFFMNFMAFKGLAQLQSTLNRDQGMGVITHSILYGVFVLSSLLLPKFVIGLLGHKWTICTSVIGYIIWMAANGYAVWATMVPASILIGMGGGCIWPAQSAYITKAGVAYARLSHQEESVVIGRFFGITWALIDFCKYYFLKF